MLTAKKRLTNHRMTNDERLDLAMGLGNQDLLPQLENAVCVSDRIDREGTLAHSS